jgi:hypothetical protein
LGVRKASGRYASKANDVELPSFEVLGKTKSVKVHQIPRDQGLYLFRCEDDSLFVGDTDNLRNRIERHFESGGDQGLPDWLYDRGSKSISLGVIAMPGVKRTSRKIIELGVVNRFNPVFNYVGGRVA